jgi:acyl-CoA reductase-like NAD-dependent aldehyde dehydrogenase
MSLLDLEIWTDKIFAGEWRAGGGGRRAVLEPATGEVLGSVGAADAADVTAAAALAAQTQPAWADRSPFERAAVLRRAAELFEEHAGDIVEWVTRESGGTRTCEALFFRPTVLADCNEDTPAYTEEVFGPVACVRPFATTEEAVRLAADTDFGLSLGIVTHDVAAAMRIADRIPVGMVHVNDQTVNDDPNAPFGGVGASGFGRVGGGRANLEAFTEAQWLTVRETPPRRPL